MAALTPLAITSKKITLTACCSRCKDIFTVWGEIKGKKIYIEPQSRIRIRCNETTVNSSNKISLKQKLYHHCGCELKFYPDYRWRS
jgi:hypothetical protein